MRHPLKRAAGWAAALLVVSGLSVFAAACQSLGHRAGGERKVRMEQSPQWHHGHFENPQPLKNDFWRSINSMVHASPHTAPGPLPLPPFPAERRLWERPPSTGLRVTWFGHSSALVELDGYRVLTDPIWSERASPLSWVGPKRWHAPPIPLEEMGQVDAVVISHDHYDHLDHRTLAAMKEWHTTFVVPLGVGAHLESWGIPAERIAELDWWESRKVGQLEIFCTPARHASGRTGVDKDSTLWAGYALVGPQHRAYYSGDTGLFPAMKKIGDRYGPFDVTLMEVGQYNQAWPDWHMGPEQAVLAHQMVKGKVLFPMHWALFGLAAHGWTEPIERVLAEAHRSGQTVVAPKPGQSVEPSAPPPLVHWWPALPWTPAAEDPIVSTQMQ